MFYNNGGITNCSIFLGGGSVRRRRANNPRRGIKKNIKERWGRRSAGD